MLFILLLSLVCPVAGAADYAVILSDAERAALLDVLDEATKAKGLAIAPTTVFLANKIKQAPVVTERKDIPDPPKEQAQ